MITAALISFIVLALAWLVAPGGRAASSEGATGDLPEALAEAA